MKKLLAILTLLLAAPLASSAQEGGLCPAVVLCDENGHYYEWVDPTSSCSQHQHQFCTERRIAAEANRARAKRLRHYTRGYARCLTWAKNVAREQSLRGRKVSERKLRSERCEKYAVRVKKLNAATR